MRWRRWSKAPSPRDSSPTSPSACFSRAIGSRHHQFTFDEASFATLLPVVAAALDEPLGDQALLPVYWLAREARKHATVVLSGEGADEVFAGYGYYAPFAPSPGVVTAVKRALGASDPTTATRLVENTPPVTPSGFPLLTDTAGRARLIPDASVSADAWETSLCTWLGGAHDPLQRATAADLATWLPDDLLVKYDRMAMAVSLEGRAPFLEPKLVAAALALPAAERMSGGQSKIALRRIARRWLPERIHARRKQGFVLPMRAWIREWLAARGGPAVYLGAQSIPGLDANELVAIVAADLEAGLQRERLLFALIMLVEWHAAATKRIADLAARYAAI